MCELKQLGARGGSVLLWSTYVTLINTQQSFTHVWGNKQKETSTLSILYHAKHHLSLYSEIYQLLFLQNMFPSSSLLTEGWWIGDFRWGPWLAWGLQGDGFWRSCSHGAAGKIHGQRWDWCLSPGVTWGGEGRGQTKGQEDGVGWHCREKEAAVTIQSFFGGKK